MLRQYTRLGYTRHWDPLRPLASTAAAPPRRHAQAAALARAHRQTPTPSIATHARFYAAPTTGVTQLRRRIRANLFTLRPYQQACVDAVLSEVDRGDFTRLGVSAPTGSGKTAIFTSLIGQIPPRRHPGLLEGGHGQVEARQVLVVVNSIQLASQTAEAIQRAYPDWTVEVEQGKSSATGLADVTVATFQTLAYNDFSRLEKFLPESHKAVIVDEAHHAAAASYLEILARFDPQVETALVRRDGGGELVVASEVIEGNPQEVEETITELEEEGNEEGGDGRVSELDGEEEEEVDELFPSGGPGLTTLNGDVEVETTSRMEAASYGPVEPAAPAPPPQYIDEPAAVPMLLDPVSGRARVPLLAFTATWGRADGLALGKVFEKIVWHADWLEMVQAKWLSAIQFTAVQVDRDTLDLDKVKTSSVTGDYNLSSLARQVDTVEFAEAAVDAWFEKAQDRRSTLVFGASVAHVVTLTNTFRARGIDARFVYEGTKQAERVETYQAFRAGEFPVLVNFGILTEGADFPEIDCVLLARPTRSQNLFLQMLGRGLRLSPASGKRDCLLIDMIAFTRNPEALVCTPTLFGLDPLSEIDGQTAEQLQARARESASAATSDEETPASVRKPELLPYSLSYTHYATVFDLLGVDSDSSQPGGHRGVPISRLSRNAWVGCGNDVWVLELMGKGYIRIARHPEAPDNYQAQLYTRLPAFVTGPGVVRYRSPQEIALHPNLAILLRTVDAYVKQHSDFSDLSLGRYAPWRMGPPSPAQGKFILQKALSPEERAEGKTTIDGVWIGRPWNVRVDVMNPDEKFTKGQACDIITRVKYGGLGYWKKQKKELVKEAKREEKVGREAVKASERKELAEAKRAEKAAERERKRVEKVLLKMNARKQAKEGGLRAAEAA
ncbi:hypothetical protein C6P46_004102 [Rhodotorula mucilaginosa]|uniref:P-loop containing nucleoside triphosphate hydrolase protein n=1 Tax=Rhodotorula mucilaginosa TaxID=5537 RepID=A0A9P6W0D6_RHOMI|nr:hypothetical protein C6P46_004102 [Rhodotorula mucilaginosa]